MTRSVLISVCTFKRPTLRRTLLSLAVQEVPTNLRAQIAVADNDDVPSARPLVEEVERSTGRSILFRHCPARNISIARNALLDEAAAQGTDLLAFLDDDEWVAPGWLAQLVRSLDDSGADAVFGPVKGVYSDDAPAWMRTGGIHDMRPEVDEAGRVRTGHTANVLMALGSPSFVARRFDLSFGRSGGEDTAFFAAAKAAGAVLAPAPAAWAFEDVPAERARVSWLVRRRFRMGQTHGSLVGQGVSRQRRAGLAAIAAAKAVGSLAIAVPSAWSRPNLGRSLLRASLHVGAASTLLGLRPIVLYGGENGSSPSGNSPASNDWTHN